MFVILRIAGNSFASTTCQVNIIASLVHSCGWRTITNTETSLVHKADDSHGTDVQEKKRHCDPLEDAQQRPNKRQKAENQQCKRKAQDDDQIVPVLKRCRGKQSVPQDCKPMTGLQVLQQIQNIEHEVVQSSGRGRPKGLTGLGTELVRDGKRGSLTVWRKMEMIREYERLKKDTSIKNVESFMLKNGKLRGGYQGCMSQSKWLGSREKYKWDAFCEHCPKLARECMEVPNAILDVLGSTVP